MCEKSLLDLHEEAKGDSSSQVGFGDDEIGQACCAESVGARGGGGIGDVVDEIVVDGVGEFRRFVVGDFGQNDGGEVGGGGGGCGCAAGVFAEDGGVVGDAAVEERCGGNRAGCHVGVIVC